MFLILLKEQWERERRRELGKGVEVTVTGFLQTQPPSAVALYAFEC